MAPRIYRVHRVYWETHDTYSVELDASSDPFHFAPGQFNMLYAFGRGEAPISISGDPGDPTRIVHTIRARGSVTDAISKLKRGDPVGVRGPFGNHWPVAESEGACIIVVGGGIGLAPLRPAILQLLQRRGEYGRVTFLYGARTPGDLLYRPDLEKWRGRFDVHVEVTVDTAQRDWYAHVGLVTTLLPLARFEPDHTIAFVCGPEIMMHFVVRDLQKRGVRSDKIYISMERHMKCGMGLCGRCQFGPYFTCKDGPVFRFDQVRHFFELREI
jgi:NAD(P)H-flavin reductase